MATLVLSSVGSSLFPGGGFIGSLIGGVIDARLFAPKAPTVYGARLEDLRIQTSTYGQVLPVVFGNARISGNVIWATDLKEVKVEEKQSGGGGKGGGGGGATTVRYEYYATLAIAICSGEIDEVVRVWADSKVIDARTLNASSGKYNVYTGTETQDPDPIMESYEGAGNVPAYRGVAYVVIQDLLLTEFGNRIPNFTFEVKRKVKKEESVESKIKDIVLIPGSGEFVYSRNIIEKYDVAQDVGGGVIQKGKKVKVNMHNFDDIANVDLTIQQLKKQLPNLEYVALVVNWFITTKNVANAEIKPKVEYSNATATTTPDTWAVAGLTRATAPVVEEFADGSATYGGTPSDKSVLYLCKKLKEEGFNVLFYPMPLVDTTSDMPGEDDKPWRGRLVPTSTSDVTTFFTRTWGYNNFIRHYSQLTVDGFDLKDYVDAFLIGSEMVGLTTYDSGGNTYPAVDRLVTLAGNVRTDLGGSVLISYAADWSEYHSVNGYYHLDPLWTDSNIDFVGIDAYFPITPDLPQTQITQDLIKQYWEDGEGWDYYYTDSVARTGLTNYPSQEFAWKNVEYWWANAHSGTGWTAKMKPIWFTEFGFASVDGTANQPNIFVDSTSDETGFPRGSKQRVDFKAQRDAINATIEYLEERNAESGKANLVPRKFLWTWDARPYPFFPDLLDVWADGGNWKYGHWISGKFGVSELGHIIAYLLELQGLDVDDYDVSELTNPVEGFVISDRITVREAIGRLADAYFFGCVESDGKLKFIKRGADSIESISENDLVPIGDKIKDILSITRKQELELPQSVDVSYFSRVADYQPNTQKSQRQTVQVTDKLTFNMPLVMGDHEAKTIADIILFSSWYSRNKYNFILPPKYSYLKPTDNITITRNGIEHTMRLVSVDYNFPGVVQVEAVAEDSGNYDFYSEPGASGAGTKAGENIPATTLTLLDLPAFPTDNENIGTLRFVSYSDADNWKGCAIYRSDDGGEAGGNSFADITKTDVESITGKTLNELGDFIGNYFDNTNTVDVVLLNGTLQSITELAVLNGGNAALIGNEIIQFQNAELIGVNTYRLSKLLRGRLGTEHETGNHAIQDSFILLDNKVIKEQIPLNMIGSTRFYKAVTVGAAVADTDEQSFSYSGIKFRPYSPTDIAGARDGSNNLTITWKRRTRLSGEWRDFVDVPLAEETEKYEIDILNGAGTTVLRTITATSQTASYSAALQTTDFGSPQSSINVKIYQISAIYGRGIAGSKAI